ncbi:MFS transporter [Bradyrhizobium prioriisuperbiae]|uniref:MFS transporter n=1 Tax=Bradyrhizobium prioriisuperbiae TaxID=2854389 RepID=UPI0028F13CDA|nr:MFS transporter [Bradyrhizobium prioritasuperba]
MIRLILLLLGTQPLRTYWWAFIVLAACSLATGIVFAAHLFDTAIIVVIDIIGIAFVIEGMARLLALAAIGFPNATIPVLKSLGFFALGFITIDVPWDDNIVATITIGGALLIDGLFRLGSAVMIRSERWRRAAVIAVIELIMAGLIWTPWPIPNRHTVPFCLGIILIAASWSLCRLGLQLRRLPSGASVTDLPLFAGPNWHGRSTLPPALAHTSRWDNDNPLTVHIWTPIGSAVDPQPRPVIDRYIAAVDQNGVIMTGHASLSLPPGTYVSLCPANDIDRSSAEFGRLLRAGTENDVPGRFKASLEEESTAWRKPDREINFRHYNAAALQAFLSRYRQVEVYNLTRRNCSSTVVLSLDAAIEGALGEGHPWQTLLALLTDPAMWLLALWRARAEAMTWTPGLVLDYAQTLQHVLERRNNRWLARLWIAKRRFEERRRAQVAEGVATQSQLPTMVSLIATAMIFGLTYGLSAPLLALSLSREGFGEGFIGANAAMHAAGVLAIAPLLPSLAWRAGPKLPIAAALLAAAAVLALFPVMPSIWLWFPLRIALGAASETLFVMSETWLSQLSDERTRTRTMAIYTTALSLGFALGPVILTTVGTDGIAPFLVGGGIALLALLSIAMPWVRAPVFERPAHRNMLRYLWLVPIALGATLINAAVETAGMSFLPLYAMRVGWDEQPATLLLSVLLLGAILMQLPIGWLGDRMDRRRLVIGLGCLSTVGALVWPLVIDTPLLAYPLLFLWGGVFVGIYTVMMALVGSRFQGGDLVSVYTITSVAWGAGAFVGPGTAGAAMDLARHGLPYFAVFACAAFTLLAILRRNSA